MGAFASDHLTETSFVFRTTRPTWRSIHLPLMEANKHFTRTTKKKKKKKKEEVKFLIDTELEAYLLAATGAPLEAINVTPIANDC